MSDELTSKYSVLQQPVETLLSWIKSGDIAIPEIQRPFVWKRARVRDLIDSLHKGYPIGYIIIWKNHDVRLKDGTLSRGKRILIDGQQRITALTAAVIGNKVLDKNYKKGHIRIAYHPGEEKFEVQNQAIKRNPLWIDDISPLLSGVKSISATRREYMEKNPEADEDLIERKLEELKNLKNQQVGIIELNASLNIDTVTEIFIRINQKGVKLSNADFVMSKIASDEEHQGNKLRRMIDYFCRLVIDKSFARHISENDKDFYEHPYYQAIKWMEEGKDELYVPEYTDVLRVALTYKFNRGKFSDLVALLSGRDFRRRTYEDEIIDESFERLEKGILAFVNKTNYQRFMMLINSAGFIDQKLIPAKNSLNFAYALYLKMKDEGNYTEAEIQKYVKRWFVFSLLKGRYSGSAESWIDYDIKQIEEKGIENVLSAMEQSELSESFFEYGLVNDLESQSKTTSGYNVYLASKIVSNTRAFLAKTMTIKTLRELRGDEHHLYPKKYLERNNFTQKDYNQVANFVYTEQNTNIKLRDKDPRLYFEELKNGIDTGKITIGTIDNWNDLKSNLTENEIPEIILDGTAENYREFLEARRKLMAKAIEKYYNSL